MKSNNQLGYLFFFINPFLAAIRSFACIRNQNGLLIILGWFLVYGMGLSDFNELADSYSYIQDFRLAGNMDFNEYKNLVGEYFSFNSSVKDLYHLSATFFISRFTTNYHVLFLFYAFVFGFFYIQSLKLFLRYPINNDVVFYALLFIFCFSNPISNVNGVRFWTAAWICVYSTLKFILDKNYWSLLFLAIVPLIHISFFIWILLLCIYVITKYFQKTWIILFILSSVLSAVSYLDIISNYADIFPPVVQAMFQSYFESERAQEIIAGTRTPLYATILLNLPGYFRLILSYVLISNRRIINQDKVSSHLFTAYLVFGSFVNFAASIPSVGVRFQQLTFPLLVLVWAINYSSLSKYKGLFFWIPVVYAYSILYWIRGIASVTEIELYIAPFPYTVIRYLF